MVKDVVLNTQDIDRKISRMAYEIYELNFKEEKMIIAGINGQGYILAGLLARQIQNISPIQTQLVQIAMDKEKPHISRVEIDVERKDISGRSVVVVDDVLNTGKTIFYSLRPFLDLQMKKIEIAVMVDRSYTRFPIKPAYTGISLSTTLNDHVVVNLSREKEVYLTES